MPNTVAEDIHNYISFLEKCGYTVSFSSFSNNFAPVIDEIIRYDFHPHDVCNYLKENPKTAGKCVLNKRILEKSDISKPTYSCCYAGAEEFLYPIIYENKRILCVHVSGYRGKLTRSARRMKNISKFCTNRFTELYNSLSADVPDEEHIAAFVKPLEYMIIELYKKCCDKEFFKATHSQTKKIYIRALKFIQENYSYRINCETIAQHLKYSKSYIRYIFKCEGNTSVQAKINEIRLNNAKRLLKKTTMSITETAMYVGFSDSNYFSSFFKAKVGCSPSKYQKEG